MPNCTTRPALRTKRQLIADGDTGDVVLKADSSGPVAISRLILVADGDGFAGLDGLVVESIRVDQRYITGGPTVGGLYGSASTQVTAEALVRLFSRYRLRAPLTLSGREELIVTLRNDAGLTRRVTLADDRAPVVQTMTTARFAPLPQSRLLTATVSVPAGADRFQIEVPRGKQGGLVETFALDADNVLEVEIGVGDRTVVEALNPDLTERLFGFGLGLNEPILVGDDEDLMLYATNTSGAPVQLSFVCEIVDSVLSSGTADTVYGDTGGAHYVAVPTSAGIKIIKGGSGPILNGGVTLADGVALETDIFGNDIGTAMSSWPGGKGDFSGDVKETWPGDKGDPKGVW